MYISKQYEQHCWVYGQRMSNNARPSFTDVEVLTIYLWGILQDHRELKKIYAYTRNHLREWFPLMPCYKNYVTRLNQLSEVFCPLLTQIQKDFLHNSGPLEMIRLMDSMPIMMAKAQRSNKAKVAAELASKGYHATKDTYYYGVKLHILGIKRPGALPIPDYLAMTKASCADINVLKNIAPDIHQTPLYADKAYIDAELAKNLAQQGAPLHTPIKKKKGQTHLGLYDEILSTPVSKIRQPIESLFPWIQLKTDIHLASKVRSTKGLIVHTFGKMAAAMLILIANF
jgi:hypothetical protein